MPKETQTHRVAVLSDTHNILRPEAVPILQSVELILHGGDVTRPDILDRLRGFAPVIAVQGNCDRNWDDPLPEEIRTDIFGLSVYMVHNQAHASATAAKADLAIFGHSHQYSLTVRDGTLWLNPGSGGPRRFGRPATMALLLMGPDHWEVQKIVLSDGSGSGCSPAPQDMYQTVTLVVRDLKKGRSTSAIADSRHLSPDLVAQIAQLYYTHPGVDTEGILNRMDIAGL